MRFTILAIIVFSAIAAAEERPIVRAEVTPTTVAVGETIELRVTVLVPTWFTRPPIYPNIELANAITRLPDDSSFPMRERIGNDSWSGIVRSYEILPLFGANYRLSGQSMSISYANPGSDPITVDVDVPEVSFQGTVPAGAAALEPYIAGSSLKLSLAVEGETADLEVGDALVLTYEANLVGLPAIFLPPLAPTMAFDGVSVYADSPAVGDMATARRSEKLTLVFDAGGVFSIPGLTLNYWNTETESISSASVDGFEVSVVGPAVAPGASEKAERPLFFWASAVAVVSVLAGIIYTFGSAAANRYRANTEKRRRSESYAFSLLQTALGANDTEEAYRSMLRWLARLNPAMSMRQLARNYGDGSLPADVELFSRMNYSASESGNSVDTSRLSKGLARARARYIRQLVTAKSGDLPTLNPS